MDILAHILLWDQISRHYRRCKGDAKAVDRCSPLAVKATCYLLKHRLSEVDGWTTSQRVFLLMPWRHLFEIEALIHVLMWYRRWASRPGEDQNLWDRFEKATIKALSYKKTQMMEAEEPKNNQQRLETWESFRPILEVTPTMESTRESIDNLKLADGRYAFELSTIKEVLFFLKQLLEFDEDEKRSGELPKALGVSVSGGVDSMLLLYATNCALKRLRMQQYEVPQLFAVHINYGNRVTADHEAGLVKEFCQMLGVPLWTRRISEIRRTRDKDRGFYESLTREIRFEVYKTAIRKSLRSVGNVSSNPILLGHNRQDTWENMLSNIAKGQKYEQLKGMGPVGQEQGITIWRPLLRVDKSQIYEDADVLGIPHLWDSTPNWSDRGRMRDVVLPFLFKEVPLLIPGLERLSEQLEFLSDAWRQQIESYWESVSIDDENMTADLPLFPWVFESKGLWAAIFKRLLDRWSIPPPSHKAMHLMQEWMVRARNGRIRGRIPAYELSKHYKALFYSGRLHIIVRNQSTNSSMRTNPRRGTKNEDG
eukprot:CAMPEP_0114490512 /NCGR_PEP_ID=MMETSP0109-20121206/2483_1 /TAXON_ID=29199 /ORGANISM="Chlorarachnion reptans, Strain CCCM449" /LENGTH=536 /DNA_ID=CAMNT_0001667137 /DNA_START=278 /DNA_END=1888 /DNA_ORIENTATION=+